MKNLAKLSPFNVFTLGGLPPAAIPGYFHTSLSGISPCASGHPVIQIETLCTPYFPMFPSVFTIFPVGPCPPGEKKNGLKIAPARMPEAKF